MRTNEIVELQVRQRPLLVIEVLPQSSKMFWRRSISASLALCFSIPSAAQDASDQTSKQQTSVAPPDKRLFGIIPNYRTSTFPNPYQPLTTAQKFTIAEQDALDRGTFVLAAAYAAEGQAMRSSASFGQEPGGYARYFAASYADWAGADFMTEAVFPSLLHQDPRYFRKGTGSAFKRLTYAMGQIFWTHSDSGGHSFNFSEVCGNATMVAISQAYYPDNRNARSAGTALAIQLGDDMASNILKEFYPDLRRWLSRRHDPAAPGGQH